jgi:hypothetical protein
VTRIFLLVSLILGFAVSAQAQGTRVQIATDDFNRASLGANWTNVNILNADSIVIKSSIKFEGNAGGPNDPATAYWAGTGTFSDDQYSSVALVDVGAGSVNYGIGAACRISTDTDSGRDFYYHVARSDNMSLLRKYVNGTATTIAGPTAVTWGVGDRVEIECQGTTIMALKNGTPIGGAFTATDSSLTTGKPGITGGNNGDLATGDNWIGGSLTSGGGGGGGGTIAHRKIQ